MKTPVKQLQLNQKYKLEYRDLLALFTLVNVCCIIFLNTRFAYLGLLFGIIDTTRGYLIDKRINCILLGIASIMLNLYFIIK